MQAEALEPRGHICEKKGGHKARNLALVTVVGKDQAAIIGSLKSCKTLEGGREKPRIHMLLFFCPARPFQVAFPGQDTLSF